MVDVLHKQAAKINTNEGKESKIGLKEFQLMRCNERRTRVDMRSARASRVPGTKQRSLLRDEKRDTGQHASTENEGRWYGQIAAPARQTADTTEQELRVVRWTCTDYGFGRLVKKHHKWRPTAFR